MRSHLIVGALVLCAAMLDAQVIFPRPLSPRNANYIIDVVLDANEKTLDGRETLIWRNISSDRINELQFHLYLNGFRNTQSTFMKESGGTNRGLSAEENGWGWTDITSIRLGDGTDLLASADFIQPDDGNVHDRTVLRVPLSAPLRPGETIRVEITFKARLPKVLARTGYAGNYFVVGQWFPKIGVWESAGMRGRAIAGWNCHQFHSNSEFYADYGVYDVTMTVPKGMVLGATGLLRSLTENRNSTISHVYHAEDVHDFVWTCSPDYQVYEETWEHVKIKLMIQPEHVGTAKDRYFQSAKAALRYFDDWLGKYPYPNLTIVDPPIYATGAGGMEYPTFITGGSVKYFPAGLRLTELVTIHEFGHEYWYGLVGNNEFEEPWMDEGFNQYSETRIMDETYGPEGSSIDFLGYREGDAASARSGYLGMKNPKASPIDTFSWSFPAGSYGGLTYNKTATWMVTLERLISRPVMDEAMRTYFERWKFKHPGRADFEAVVNEVVQKHHGSTFGPSLAWFFTQMLDGAEQCDYAIGSLESRPVARPRGHGIDEAVRKDETKLIESKVVAVRKGEVMMPVTVEVQYEDSTMETVTWDGRERARTFTFIRNSPVRMASVDPRRTIWIDVDFSNNVWTTDVPGGSIWKYTAKALYWLQNVVLYSAIL